MILQSHEKAEKCLGCNLESPEQISLLEYLECCAGENSLILDNLIGCEHVQTPGVDVVQDLELEDEGVVHEKIFTLDSSAS